MEEKYRAKIHGDTIEWSGDVPEEVANDGTMDVYVTRVRDVKNSEPNGKRAMEILQKIADRGGIESIPDPDKWLREIRTDRPLPGR